MTLRRLNSQKAILPIIEETESGEPISANEIHEIEELFADILFEAWLKEKSAAQPLVVPVKAAV